MINLFYDYPIELKDGLSVLFPIVILISLIGVFLPISYNLFIIVGIVIDIFGAFIILSPFFNMLKKYNLEKYKKMYFTLTITKVEIDPLIEIKNNTNRALLGFFILSAGFVIQMLANIMQMI